jgi:TM2 domain-containing membrane protein YozV
MFKIFLFTLLYSFSVYSQSKTLQFADELMGESDYNRAMTVLKEAEYVHRGTKEGFLAQKKIISLHFRSNDFELLDLNVSKLRTNYGQFFKLDEMEIKSEVSFFLKNYDVAFIQILKSQSELEKKYLFRSFSSKNDKLPKCDSNLCNQISNLEIEMKTNPPKSPAIAAALGIIPGMGQIYAGHTASGITTFILTGFFAATTVIALNGHEDAFALASGAVGTVFYLSSIYAGHETAKLRNESFIKGQQKKLRDLQVSFKLIDLAFE